MPEPIARDEQPESKLARQLSLSREIVTATLAIAIVATTLALLILAWAASGDQQQAAWDRSKELLLFVNGLVGVVVGYYFGRTPSELRAQTAEAATRGALREASRAREDLDRTLGGFATIADAMRVEPNDDSEAAQVVLTPEHAMRLRELSRPRSLR